MGQRRDRLNKRISKAITSRRKNSVTKAEERNRREQEMMQILKQGKLPYTPGVMSWLSVKLSKKATRIEAADVKNLLKQKVK